MVECQIAPISTPILWKRCGKVVSSCGVVEISSSNCTKQQAIWTIHDTYNIVPRGEHRRDIQWNIIVALRYLVDGSVGGERLLALTMWRYRTSARRIFLIRSCTCMGCLLRCLLQGKSLPIFRQCEQHVLWVGRMAWMVDYWRLNRMRSCKSVL